MIETRASQAKKQDKPAEPKSADVEMKPVETKEDLDGAIVMEITQNISLVERAVSTLESRFSTRAIRATSSIRHKLRPDILLSALNLLGGGCALT